MKSLFFCAAGFDKVCASVILRVPSETPVLFWLGRLSSSQGPEFESQLFEISSMGLRIGSFTSMPVSGEEGEDHEIR